MLFPTPCPPHLGTPGRAHCPRSASALMVKRSIPLILHAGPARAAEYLPGYRCSCCSAGSCPVISNVRCTTASCVAFLLPSYCRPHSVGSHPTSGKDLLASAALRMEALVLRALAPTAVSSLVPGSIRMGLHCFQLNTLCF